MSLFVPPCPTTTISWSYSVYYSHNLTETYYRPNPPHLPPSSYSLSAILEAQDPVLLSLNEIFLDKRYFLDWGPY